MLESETIPGLSSTRPSGSRRPQGAPAYTLDSLLLQLSAFHKVLKSHDLEPAIVQQAVRQLLFLISGTALNYLLLRRDACSWSQGVQLRSVLVNSRSVAVMPGVEGSPSPAQPTLHHHGSTWPRRTTAVSHLGVPTPDKVQRQVWYIQVEPRGCMSLVAKVVTRALLGSWVSNLMGCDPLTRLCHRYLSNTPSGLLI